MMIFIFTCCKKGLVFLQQLQQCSLLFLCLLQLAHHLFELLVDDGRFLQEIRSDFAHLWEQFDECYP